jgi:hypothetical protein
LATTVGDAATAAPMALVHCSGAGGACRLPWRRQRGVYGLAAKLHAGPAVSPGRAGAGAGARASAVKACCCHSLTPAPLLRHTDAPTGMSSHSVCRSTDAPGEVLAAMRVGRCGYAWRVLAAVRVGRCGYAWRVLAAVRVGRRGYAWRVPAAVRVGRRGYAWRFTCRLQLSIAVTLGCLSLQSPRGTCPPLRRGAPPQQPRMRHPARTPATVAVGRRSRPTGNPNPSTAPFS